MKAVFSIACPTMLAKNGLPIAEIFKTKEPDFSAIFVSADAASQTDPEMERSSENKITKDNRYRLIHFKSFNRKHIEKIFEKRGARSIFSSMLFVSMINCGSVYVTNWVSKYSANNTDLKSTPYSTSQQQLSANIRSSCASR